MANIYYNRTDEFWRKEEKYDFLNQAQDLQRIEWQMLDPNTKHAWLTEGLQTEFEDFLAIGSKDAKAGDGDAIFENYGNGVQTNRDPWVYNFSNRILWETVQSFIDTYNNEVYRWQSRNNKQVHLDDFITRDDSKIKWSSNLKAYLQQNRVANYAQENIRSANYRPFVRQYLYFDEILIHRQGQWSYFFPKIGCENLIIWLKIGSAWPMFAIASKYIVDQLPQGGSQCFPFYTYDEDGSHRRENITAWALAQYQGQYQDQTITKWDIFHYVYALLHHPTYRETYAANLRRELPRIPFVKDFWDFAQAGARLAEIHVNYEQQPEYPLHFIETPGEPLNWRVEKMRLAKDKSQLKYNEFLTLAGIPPQVFEYRLGNRSALDWIIDQYQVKTDKRSGIVNDPNNLDDEQYIVRLISQVITVSLETVEIVKGLPEWEIIGESG